MASVINGWDGVWASLCGGLVSGVTVVVGVYLTQFLTDRRKRAHDERAAADALALEVGRARDAAVHSRSKAPTGSYDLEPLRHQIYLAHSLRGLPVLGAVKNYYDAVWTLRDWVRHESGSHPGQPSPTRAAYSRAFDEYRQAIDDWAGQVMEALVHPQAGLDERILQGPSRPRLPRDGESPARTSANG